MIHQDHIGYSAWVFKGIGRSRRKVKESAVRMNNIPSTMVLHKHVDGENKINSTMSVPLLNNTMENVLD